MSQQSSSSPCVLVPIAHGTEEMEAVILIDTLRRAGAHVIVANVTPNDHPNNKLLVTASRNVKIEADTTLEDVIQKQHTFDAIILPGGMKGAENFRDSNELVQLIKKQGRLFQDSMQLEQEKPSALPL
jgi:4-methyl-5(b-hydroxyethyl)-thiazole monophosphate biosynthesis